MRQSCNHMKDSYEGYTWHLFIENVFPLYASHNVSIVSVLDDIVWMHYCLFGNREILKCYRKLAIGTVAHNIKARTILDLGRCRWRDGGLHIKWVSHLMMHVIQQCNGLMLAMCTDRGNEMWYAGLTPHRAASSISLGFFWHPLSQYMWTLQLSSKQLCYIYLFSCTLLEIKLLLLLQIDGLVQERPNSIANAMELHLSCTNPSS